MAVVFDQSLLSPSRKLTSDRYIAYIFVHPSPFKELNKRIRMSFSI